MWETELLLIVFASTCLDIELWSLEVLLQNILLVISDYRDNCVLDELVEVKQT